MTFFILIFGEITPKSFSHQHSIGVSLAMCKPVYVLQMILFPFVWFFDKVVHFTNRMFGNGKGQTVTEGEIVAMLKIGEEEGAIEMQEKKFIENVLEFNDIEVGDIMTPRVVMKALDGELTLQEAVDFAIEHSFSRLPIYKDNVDNIVGILSIRELLKFFYKFTPDKKIASLKLSPPLEVPLSKKIDDLFKDFQKNYRHLAIVIDDHGGTAGLVTMEDVLEEIVGDIADEADVSDKPIDIVDPKTIIAKGSALVEDINDFFKIKFGKNDHESVHSMLVDHLHRFPREGECIELQHARVKILKMRNNVIDKVKITKKK